MDVAFLDSLALNGTGVLYRCSPAAKMAMAILLVGAVVATGQLSILALILAVNLALMYLNRLPFRKMLPYTAYPAFFAMIFALSAGGLSLWTVLVLVKSVAAALSLLVLIGTTSFVDIFALLRRFLPKLLADGLFMTYRSFFIMVRAMANFYRSVSLKGGYSAASVTGNIRNMAQAIAVLFLKAWEMSERMYDVMALRGYSGRIGLERKAQLAWPWDLLPVSIGVTIFTMAVII